MKLSKYVTRYNLGEYTAFYHSLRMKPVFLTSEETKLLDEWINKNNELKLSQEVLNALKEYLILVETDDGIIEWVQEHADKPYTCLAYFILTEQCNLACKYCFLGNSSNSKDSNITNYPMSKETADKALEFFGLQTKQDMSQFDDEKEIIFYGGEPLINFETLKYVVDRSKYYQEKRIIGRNLNFSMVTNGLLLDEEKIQYLIDNNINVSISIDGADEETNSSRVGKNGNPSYKKLISKLKLAKSMGLNFGLSITLTDNTIKDINKLLQFLEELDSMSICFNILLKNKDYETDNSYYINATEFIIEFYKKTKDIGIYEERFMRKLKAFSESKIYFSDCAATSGSQIVITPDGQVGICHGCTEKREHFIGDIFDENFIVKDNSEVIQWSKCIPVFKNECMECPALGICGGGCPINAKKIHNTENINAIDSNFCIHAKNSLEFLIKELLKIMLS